ncbi:MAG: hypothetical protein IPL78_18585 [Chloroflexi bacterium]|nr:hypothetical protein [Chloroflexota bacterium]
MIVDNSGFSSFTGSNNLIDDFTLPACSGISAAAVTNFVTTLQDNGGPTDTHALLVGSNALNTGTGNCPDHTATPLARDQRGVARPQNLTCDIGAYELVTAVTPGANGGNGPGGVSTTDGSSLLEAWFRADRGAEEANNDPAETGDNVEFWRDQSGNNTHVSQALLGRRPNWTDAALNGQPALAYTGGTNGDVLTTTLAAFAGDQPYTIFSAFNPANNNGENLFAIGSPNFFETIAYHPNLFDNRWYYHFGDDMLVTPLLSGWQLASFRYEALGSGTDRSYYANGSLAGSNAANPLALAANPLLSVGGFDNRAGLEGQELTGQLGELIIFSTSLVEVERILVENYLSSKYNLAIPGADDHYEGDTSPGEFDLDVAGIGQLGGNQHTQAHGAGMIVVNGTFLNENGDWLLFGHRTVNNSNSTADLPTGGDWGGVNDVRWARHWTIDVTDPSVNNGTVDVIFDFSEAGMNGGLPPSTPASHYRLLKRTGPTGPFSDITVASGALVVVAGDQVQFLGVDVAQLGSNFTLGSIDGAAAPTAITTQNLASPISQPPYLALILLLLVLLAITIKIVWRRIV